MSAGEVEELGQSMPPVEQEPTEAITNEGLHKGQAKAGADESARAPVADASEWASESDDGGASQEEDEDDEAEGEKRVAQTAVEQYVEPMTTGVLVADAY